MIKYVLPAAVAVVALAATGTAHAQLKQPMAPAATNPYVTDVNATIVGQPEPAPNEYYAPMPMGLPIVSPRTTWIPGHYEWDPSTSNYVFIEGQFVEAPHENTQWVPGRWAETPSSWIWIPGHWS